MDRTECGRMPAGEGLLAEATQDPRQFGLGPFVDDLVGSVWGVRSHAHVERPVVPVGEAPLR